MILKSLTVWNLGSVDFFSHSFTDGLNTVGTLFTDEISYAICTVMNSKAVDLCGSHLRIGSRIEAEIVIEDRLYYVNVTRGERRGRASLTARDEGGSDVTGEYLHLTSHCDEHDLSGMYVDVKERIPSRLIRYMDEERYFAPGELSERTSGLSHMKSFRSYLRDFIRNFKSEPICPGKKYQFLLSEDGSYVASYTDCDGMPVLLSECESVLFRFLCALRTAEFWRGFEEMRNLNAVKKPFVIKGLLERIDESLDIGYLLDRAVKINDQVILLTSSREK